MVLALGNTNGKLVRALRWVADGLHREGWHIRVRESNAITADVLSALVKGTHKAREKAGLYKHPNPLPSAKKSWEALTRGEGVTFVMCWHKTIFNAEIVPEQVANEVVETLKSFGFEADYLTNEKETIFYYGTSKLSE